MRSNRINPLSLNDPQPPKLIWQIYVLKDPADGWFRYVGQTNDLELRLKQHLTDRLAHGNYAKQRWLEDLKQRGATPDVEVLQRCHCQKEADEAEREHIRRLIDQGHPLFNHTDGGLGNRSASRIRSARLADWIELCYLFKCARENASRCMIEVQDMVSKNSGEVSRLSAAIKKLDEATWLLRSRVEAEYPSWPHVSDLVHASHHEHQKRLADEHARLESEAANARMTSGDLDRVMAEHPDLTWEGFGVSSLHPKREQDAQAKLKAELRDRLRGCLDSCNNVLAWLNGIEKSTHITTKFHSGSIKHLAEEGIGDYVSEGTLIAAAIWRGFRFRPLDGTTGVYFNMSTRSLEAREGQYEKMNARTSTESAPLPLDAPGRL